METIDDIVRDMRCGVIPHHRHDRELLRNYADRIEAAYHRIADDAVDAVMESVNYIHQGATEFSVTVGNVTVKSSEREGDK